MVINSLKPRCLQNLGKLFAQWKIWRSGSIIRIMPNSFFRNLYYLWSNFTQRRKFQFFLLLLLVLIASFAEILSIGSVLPFLTVLSNPQAIFNYSFFHFLSAYSEQELLIFFTLGFVFSALFAGLMRLLMLWATTKLSFSLGAELGFKIYNTVLYQPYTFHISRNSSDLISVLTTKMNTIVFSIINPLFILIGSLIMLIIIITALLIIDPTVGISAFGFFGIIYLYFMKISKRHLELSGAKSASQASNQIKILQEALGNIRNVLLDGTQKFYSDSFKKSNSELRRAQATNSFIAQSPRYLMESFSMIFIAFLSYIMAKYYDGIERTIPILGALALGAQRMMPVFQQAYSSWAIIKGNLPSLNDSLSLIESTNLGSKKRHSSSQELVFSRDIRLTNIRFKYSKKSSYILNNINIIINKGARIGLIGVTGSGKSTLMDIFMGLLEPTKGFMQIDGVKVGPHNIRTWQNNIAHVPQHIFLIDSTIAENIALGIPKDLIDYEILKDSANKAYLSEVIDTLPLGYNTVIGERGIKLSGGQRQRIGIARALYKRASVIFFDEATSALDSKTESIVMSAIDNMNITSIIIAHRLTTLKKCDLILQLTSGRLESFFGYDELMRSVNK